MRIALNVEIQNTSMQIISLGKTDPGTMNERAQQLVNILATATSFT